MTIGYLVHDLTDAAVLRRKIMLEGAGLTVDLAGFQRSACLKEATAGRNLRLGVTHDGALASRAASVLRWVARPDALRSWARTASVLIARNLESLALAVRIAAGRPIVYECLDIHRSLLNHGPADRAVQALEGWLLERVDRIWTSSPAFAEQYFAHRPTVQAPVTLIENKMAAIDSSAPLPAPPDPPPFTIGWFGMLRCRRSFDTLAALAAAHPDRLRVLIAGKPSPAVFPDWPERIAASPDVTFTGPFAAADLPALYGRCHFAWAIDWFEAGQNSDWLLPNRLYEAQAHGCVPIALSRVETGRWLKRHGTGLVLDGDGQTLGERLSSMTADEWRAMRAAVAAVPREALIDFGREGERLAHDLRALMSARA